LFTDLEMDMIKKEYTYNDPRRYNRNENEEPNDCFTEHNLESVYNTLKNVSTKSIILAPFNSTQSDIGNHYNSEVKALVIDKMDVLKFAKRCREVDRKYEDEFNDKLDNGVYHRPANDSDEGKSGDETEPGAVEVNQRLSSEELNEYNEEIDFEEDLEQTQKVFQGKF